MNVLFDHQVFSLQEYGGISGYFIELANGLLESNQIKPYICAPLYINKLLAHNSGKFNKYNIELNSRYFKKRLIYEINTYISKLIYLRTKPDIVHETYYSCEPILRGRKNIITVHDMIEELFRNKKSYSCSVKRKAVERADHVICISSNTRNDLVELLNVDKSKTSVIHLAHRTFNMTSHEYDDLVFQRPYILYVGKRSGYKNFLRVIEGYEINVHVNTEVDLVCFGGGDFNEREVQIFKEKKLTHNIHHFSGSDELLYKLYSDALFLIYPSIYEGFGLPPLEAMSIGCPVVASTGGSIPEILGTAPMYFDPFNVEEIASTLSKIVFDDSTRTRLIEDGLKQSKKYSWHKTVKETSELYKIISTQ